MDWLEGWSSHEVRSRDRPSVNTVPCGVFNLNRLNLSDVQTTRHLTRASYVYRRIRRISPQQYHLNERMGCSAPNKYASYCSRAVAGRPEKP